MAYSIRRTGKLIRITMETSSNEAELTRLKKEVLRLSTGRRVDILVDISQIDGNLPVPKNIHDFFDGLQFRRYAIYGAKHRAALITKQLLDELPENTHLKLFHTEEDARAWLESGRITKRVKSLFASDKRH
jgi:hypothetical protein